jgi:hypothetical protein
MKGTPNMELARFEALLDQRGADLARFPEPERAAAAALLARDPRARGMLAQADAIERGLLGMAAPEPSAALRRAVAEIPLRHPQPEPMAAALSWLPLRSLWALVASGALMLALGALSGVWASDLDLSLQDAEQVQAEQTEDDALTELSELAFAAELDEELSP